MCNAGFVRKLREVQRQAVLDCHLIRTRRRRAADFRRVFCRSQAGSGALLAPLDVEAHVAHARLEDLLRRGVEFNANINVGVGFSMKGTVAYGFEYKPSESPSTALISERDFRQEYSVNQISGTANLAMRASIMPVMNIRVQGFGGPSVGLKAMLEFALKADSSNPECKLSAASEP